jgi:hypothetical protein
MATAVRNAPDVVVTPPPAPLPRRRAHGGLVVAVWLAFVVGFVIALAALAHPRWFPILDLAQTEMRLRDVFTSHPPLIGLPGRIGSWSHQGSHPGPLSFWALAVFYQLFGASAWAMQVATACLNAIAIGTALLIGRRRGSTTMFVAVGATVAVLTYFYGPSVLTQAWNPYLPLMWFVVFALAVWSVLCDDLAMLPVAAFAACFCLQTHISYVGLVGGLGALTCGWVVWSLFRRPDALGPRRWWWVGSAAAIVVVTWIPPVVEQLTSSEGNLTLIWRHFTDPPEAAIGMRAGARILLVHLNPWRLLAGQDGTTGSVVPGIALLLAWAAGVVVAIRRRVRALIALDVVILVALGLGAFSIASIFGFVWYYLMFWGWQLNALLIFSTVWAGVVLLRSRAPREDSYRRIGTVAAAVVMVGYLAGFAVDASTVEPPTPQVSATVGRLAQDAIRAIDAGKLPGGGREGRYQATIVDTVTINSPSYGLVSELQRVGIHAGFPDGPAYRAIVGSQRIVPKEDATGVVHYSVGAADIAKWRKLPGVTMVGRDDPRTPAQRREAIRLHRLVLRQLQAAGLADLVPSYEGNVFAVSLAPELPASIRRTMQRELDIGRASAVFIGPPQYAI